METFYAICARNSEGQTFIVSREIDGDHVQLISSDRAWIDDHWPDASDAVRSVGSVPFIATYERTGVAFQ